MKLSATLFPRRNALASLIAALVLLAGMASDAHAQISSVTKVTQDAEGNDLSAAGDHFGAAVAGLGFDPPDQLDDPLALLAAVGAPGTDDERGAVYGLALADDGSVTDVTALGGLITISESGVLATIAGDDPGDRFGTSFAPAVRVTPGDALAAGVVGAPGAEDDTGTVYLYGLSVDLDNLSFDVTRAQTYNGGTVSGLTLSPGDRFGAALAALGDVDGDSATAEVAVGAPGTGSGQGAVHVLSIDTSDGSASLFTTIDDSALGGGVLSDGDHFGSGIAFVKDVELEDDLMMTVGAEGGGVLYWISVSDGGNASFSDVDDGASSGSRFGASVGTFEVVSDVFPTVVVGAPASSDGGTFEQEGFDPGSLFSRDFIIGTDELPGDPLSDGDRFGESLFGIPGDIDDNGIMELVAGTPGDDSNGDEAGAAYVLFPDQAVLPVEFAGTPQATVDGRDVTLAWTTFSEHGNAGFQIQHQRAGQSGWTTANDALVEGAGTATTAHSYRYTVRGLDPGSYSFRVRQVDIGSGESFSPTVEVRVGAGSFALQAPVQNPVTGSRATLSYSAPEEANVQAALYNSLGQQVRRLDAESGTVSVETAGLASGLYFVRLVTADGQVEVQSVTLVR